MISHSVQISTAATTPGISVLAYWMSGQAKGPVTCHAAPMSRARTGASVLGGGSETTIQPPTITSRTPT